MTNLTANDPTTFVQTWLAENGAAEHAKTMPASDWLFFKLCQKEPQTAWLLIERIYEAAQNDKEVLCRLAVGPLEDLLAANGSKVIDALEQRAATDELFRRILSGVWRQNMDPSIWARVQRIAIKDGFFDAPAA